MRLSIEMFSYVKNAKLLTGLSQACEHFQMIEFELGGPNSQGDKLTGDPVSADRGLHPSQP